MKGKELFYYLSTETAAAREAGGKRMCGGSQGAAKVHSGGSMTVPTGSSSVNEEAIKCLGYYTHPPNNVRMA